MKFTAAAGLTCAPKARRAKPKSLNPFTPDDRRIPLRRHKSRRGKRNITEKRLFERIRDEYGFTGGLTNVKDYSPAGVSGHQEDCVCRWRIRRGDCTRVDLAKSHRIHSAAPVEAQEHTSSLLTAALERMLRGRYPRRRRRNLWRTDHVRA